ncbi:hypothetical protein LBMAG53_24930 [Planctomycetota bacterium]|nr:hypothetical protein LBMAG53_24930 [Planctomycetota bacterium]
MFTPIRFIFAAAIAGAALTAAEPAPLAWPAAVPNWTAPVAGEHPRLFFRKSDIPEIRKRAETADGKRMVERLRLLLDGKQGTSLPAKINPPGNDAGKEPLGGRTFDVLLVGGKPAEPVVQGDRIVVGGQEITHDGSKILLKVMAGPPKLSKFGQW